MLRKISLLAFIATVAIACFGAVASTATANPPERSATFTLHVANPDFFAGTGQQCAFPVVGSWDVTAQTVTYFDSAGNLVLSAAASASGPVDLHNGGDLHEGVGQGDTKGLRPGVTYQASSFPVGLRVRPPDGRWGGVQFESGRFRFIQLYHHRTGSVPLHGVGYITLEAAEGRTPSAATTINRLHATPHLAASAIQATRVAGFAGKEFNATVTGMDGPRTAGGVSLVPFTTNHHCGFCDRTPTTETHDVKFAGKGQLFRIIVLDVRGRTVVIYVESGFAAQPRFPPAKTFPTFLPYAQRMLSTLVFPR